VGCLLYFTEIQYYRLSGLQAAMEEQLKEETHLNNQISENSKKIKLNEEK
jgi:hypothetical protein